jgi:hypothetical protein
MMYLKSCPKCKAGGLAVRPVILVRLGPENRELGVPPTDVVYSLEAGTAPPMPPCGRR